jgi:hypothetical protein
MAIRDEHQKQQLLNQPSTNSPSISEEDPIEVAQLDSPASEFWAIEALIAVISGLLAAGAWAIDKIGQLTGMVIDYLRQNPPLEQLERISQGLDRLLSSSEDLSPDTIKDLEALQDEVDAAKGRCRHGGGRGSGANRRDREQIESVAQEFGMSSNERRAFGDHIEDLKQRSGRRGDCNFTYEELQDIARDFLESLRRRSELEQGSVDMVTSSMLRGNNYASLKEDQRSIANSRTPSPVYESVARKLEGIGISPHNTNPTQFNAYLLYGILQEGHTLEDAVQMSVDNSESLNRINAILGPSQAAKALQESITIANSLINKQQATEIPLQTTEERVLS